MGKEKQLRIVMAVTNDLVTDRRVLRHAAALREAGYEVLTVGRGDVPTRHSSGWRFYAEYNIALRRRIARLAPDIVWANDTDTLLGCWLASRVSRLAFHSPRLVLDCHELFPEVPEIQGKPLVKWVWNTIERFLMPKCDALFTVCDSIAEHYRLKYGVSMTVVRNLSFGVGSGECVVGSTRGKMLPTTHYPLPTKNTPFTLLYQGCVNVGRGVDWAIDALEWLPDCRLVVVGGGDLLDEMRRYAAAKLWRERVCFLGRLKPEKLEPLTRQADVGLVMLEDKGLSYHYALPNRIGDFVAAGVPMVVSDLPEMAAVVKRFPVGEIIREPGAKGLAEAVKRVLEKGREGYDFTEARKDMDWNKEKDKLLKICYTTFC